LPEIWSILAAASSMLRVISTIAADRSYTTNAIRRGSLANVVGDLSDTANASTASGSDSHRRARIPPVAMAVTLAALGRDPPQTLAQGLVETAPYTSPPWQRAIHAARLRLLMPMLVPNHAELGRSLD
jgi:hypothetical protein